ncbi:hypothetical protein LHYA1_G003917 [Lachnellula hyalina]|uniref:Uncharacterized protein n=1 Tax=Lachnellula hyalina TaxID=1316788 RepID=A0A8H8U037_9HELO|nr:uncharacterized protein LHYA1_G003917 [Lachnellula hyalina]TVY26527.1 hypothetical protein LHYA1_G003917 [Lachnellula hyalina]
MGNLCGKESSDPFAQPGRLLSSAPAPNTNTPTAPAPKHISSPPRKLGSSSATAQSSAAQEDARRKAAEAAEARAKAANSKPKGTLAGKLEQQKRQTRTDTLEASSKDTRRARDADAAAETRAYN